MQENHKYNDFLNILDDKVVLVTGGTGSFGNAFARAALKSNLKKLIIFSRDELKQSRMQTEIKDERNRLRYFIGDIRDKERLHRAFKGVDVVVHAAALKQVPALEYNPFEAVKTNVLGTQNIIEAGCDNGVKKIILISSDKAVNSVNLYGATKLCAEKVMIAANHYDGPICSIVRYGNVLGSRGSILDVLKKQRETGKVYLTDERMTRFWITLEEGVSLVLRALDIMRGGEIFVPELASMRVVDLLQAMAPECEVEKIGIRPGEKIHESLITEGEAIRTLKLGDIFVVCPIHENWTDDHLKEAEPVQKNFTYSSDQNSRWLDKETLQKMIDEII